MKKKRILSLVLVFALVMTGLLMAQEKKADREIYEKGKKAVYQKSWEEAIDQFRYLADQYRDSHYLAESLYWMSYSLNKQSESLDDLEEQMSKKEESIARLNALISNYESSRWIDEARVLRVKIAEDLVNRGVSDYRIYITGSLHDPEELEGVLAAELEALQGVEGMEGLIGLASIGTDLAELGTLGLIGLEGCEEDPELELKLVALNALMNVDSEKAFPILVKIIQEGENSKLRRNALFILSQSKDPQVLPI
ncbi:MAG: hypothetical protein GQ544_02565, partial [Candidatus Aminicenantes bacterium]|nr:hypothetical protein [Candidatus Aminicenantes bacterium]